MSRPTSCSEYGVVFALIFAACTPVPAAVSPVAPASSAASDAAPGASAEAPVTIAAAAPAPDATDRAAAQDPAANGGAQNADVGAPSEAAPGDEEQANGAALAPPADVAAAPADAKRTASGLAYKVLERSKQSNQPLPYDRVTVHYTGWTTDGHMFDSSIVRDQPILLPLSKVIPGWSEGVQHMVEGDTARLWIPEVLAYKGNPGAPQGMLVFDVTLLEIEPRGSDVPVGPDEVDEDY